MRRRVEILNKPVFPAGNRNGWNPLGIGETQQIPKYVLRHTGNIPSYRLTKVPNDFFSERSIRHPIHPRVSATGAGRGHIRRGFPDRTAAESGCLQKRGMAGSAGAVRMGLLLCSELVVRRRGCAGCFRPAD